MFFCWLLCVHMRVRDPRCQCPQVAQPRSICCCFWGLFWQGSCQGRTVARHINLCLQAQIRESLVHCVGCCLVASSAHLWWANRDCERQRRLHTSQRVQRLAPVQTHVPQGTGLKSRHESTCSPSFNKEWSCIGLGVYTSETVLLAVPDHPHQRLHPRLLEALQSETLPPRKTETKFSHAHTHSTTLNA